MSSVVARVELHAASWQDYENLHSYMSAEGYSKKILASDGNWYQLPTGTYVHSSVLSTADGADKAARAANRTGKSSWVFVAGWDGSWQGAGLARSS